MGVFTEETIKAAANRLSERESVVLRPDDIFNLLIAIREQNIAGMRLARAVISGRPDDARDALDTFKRADYLLDEWLVLLAKQDANSNV